jgi:hypothetical protein
MIIILSHIVSNLQPIFCRLWRNRTLDLCLQPICYCLWRSPALDSNLRQYSITSEGTALWIQTCNPSAIVSEGTALWIQTCDPYAITSEGTALWIQTCDPYAITSEGTAPWIQTCDRMPWSLKVSCCWLKPTSRIQLVRRHCSTQHFVWNSVKLCINDDVEFPSGIVYFLFVVTSHDSQMRAVTFSFYSCNNIPAIRVIWEYDVRPVCCLSNVEYFSAQEGERCKMLKGNYMKSFVNSVRSYKYWYRWWNRNQL